MLSRTFRQDRARVAPLVVVSPLSTTARGAHGSVWMPKSKIEIFDFQFYMFSQLSNTWKIWKVVHIFVEPTIQSSTKFWNFFLRPHKSPHPRRNDEAKPQGEPIIEPGVRGCIIALGVRGMGENRKMGTWKKFHTFVEHGRKLGWKFQNEFEKVGRSLFACEQHAKFCQIKKRSNVKSVCFR